MPSVALGPPRKGFIDWRAALGIGAQVYTGAIDSLISLPQRAMEGAAGLDPHDPFNKANMDRAVAPAGETALNTIGVGSTLRLVRPGLKMQPKAFRGESAADDVPLDLPMDEASRAARAEEMGHTREGFHGTNQRPFGRYEEDFTEFKRSPTDIGIHFGTAGQATDRLYYAGGGQGVNERIFPVKLKLQNPLRLDDLGSWTPERVEKALRKLPEFADVAELNQIKWMPLVKSQYEALQKIIKSKGYDGIVYSNRAESSGLGPHRYEHMRAKAAGDDAAAKRAEEAVRAGFRSFQAEDSVIVFDPNQVRSKFAKFDPAKADSGNILYSGGKGAKGLGTASEFTREEIARWNKRARTDPNGPVESSREADYWNEISEPDQGLGSSPATRPEGPGKGLGTVLEQIDDAVAALRNTGGNAHVDKINAAIKALKSSSADEMPAAMRQIDEAVSELRIADKPPAAGAPKSTMPQWPKSPDIRDKIVLAAIAAGGAASLSGKGGKAQAAEKSDFVRWLQSLDDPNTIREMKAWFQTPEGQWYLEVAKRRAAGLPDPPGGTFGGPPPVEDKVTLRRGPDGKVLTGPDGQLIFDHTAAQPSDQPPPTTTFKQSFTPEEIEEMKKRDVPSIIVHPVKRK